MDPLKERRNGFLASSHSARDPLLNRLLAARQLYLYSAVRSSWMTRDPLRYVAALRPPAEHDSEEDLIDSLECLLDFPFHAQGHLLSTEPRKPALRRERSLRTQSAPLILPSCQQAAVPKARHRFINFLGRFGRAERA